MAHSINANPVPKLYRSIIEDVIENVAEIFAEEGIDEQILKELKQLWESKVMQSKATEGFFRDHHSSTQFVLQLPQNLHQALQTSTASLVIPGGRSVQNFTSSGLSSSRSSTTFTLPPGISYPIHVPAGVTLQTASGHLYKVNVPVMVTQTPSGPRILQHQQLFQHLGPSSFQTAVSQLKTASELGPQRSQLQKSVTQLCNESQALQQKQIGKDIALEPPVLDPPRQYVDNQQHILIDENHNQKNSALTEQSPSDPLQALSMQKHPEFDFIDQAETGKTDLTVTSQSVQEHFLKEPTNLAQHQVPDDTIELLLLDDGLDESESLTKQSDCSLSEEVPTFGSKTKVHNNFEIIQIDGTGDTSSDEEMGTVHDVEENEFLGIIDTEDLKALEEDDSGSNEDSTSNSSDDEEPEIDAIEEDPLNSGDDVSEQEVPDLFDTDNVIVCQYDKIHRSKNKWKFYLKDGVMSFGGKDYVFSKAIGEAEW